MMLMWFQHHMMQLQADHLEADIYLADALSREGTDLQTMGKDKESSVK